MKPLPTFRDPMLSRIHGTIRAMRQAQRQTIAKTFRTLEEAEAALDSLACDGLYQGQRITRSGPVFVFA
jgi:hypothetical protein